VILATEIQMKSLVFLLGLISLTQAVYPLPSYQRRFQYADPYTNSYCVMNGEPGTAQGIDRQEYEGVQPCSVGQFALWDYLPEINIMVGAIGSSAAAVSDLGSARDIQQRYNISNVVNNGFFSLMFDERENQFFVGKDPQVQLNESDTNSLLETHTSTTFVPVVGHVYLVRITDGASTSSFKESEFLARVVVSEWDPINGFATIRWDILYGATEDDVPPELIETEDTAETALIVGSVALGFSLVLLVTLIVSLLLSRNKTGSMFGSSVNYGAIGEK